MDPSLRLVDYMQECRRFAKIFFDVPDGYFVRIRAGFPSGKLKLPSG